MSLEQPASQPQQSAPMPPTVLEGAGAPASSTPTKAPETLATPATPAAAPAAPSAPAQSAPASGAAPDSLPDDWRARRSGGDAKKIEMLSRYQSEEDWANSWFEQKAALSKRAEPVRLAENATPEQVAEHRKGLGLPEVSKDAPPEKYMEAYKVKIPDGYDADDFEKGMLSDFTKQAYEKGWSPTEVKGATDFFFQQQAAAKQVRNDRAVQRMKEWQGDLRAELDRDYEAQIGAATDWLKAQFSDDPDGFIEITKSELPGGGRLGDHPWFVKTVAKLAMADGYTDRIEANAYESTGKSLAQQQLEIEALRTTDRALYNDSKTQAKLDKIISLRLSRGEIDEQGNEVKKRRSA